MQQKISDTPKNLFQPCNYCNRLENIEERLYSLEEGLIPALVLTRSQAERIAELESKADPYSQDGTAFCNETSD